jgi:DNA-directed RNA polymerase subunit beta'
MQQALQAARSCTLHSKIIAACRRRRRATADHRVVETTPGRMLLAEILPRSPRCRSSDQPPADQEGNQNVIDMVYRHCGQKETVIFADRLMGSASATPAGRHLVRQGRHDHPEAKVALVEKTRRR